MKFASYSKLGIIVILSLFVQLFSFFISVPQVEANHPELSESDFYDYLRSINVEKFNEKGKKASHQTYLIYGVIAYGSASDVSPNDYEKATRDPENDLGSHCKLGRYEYRYLGRTYDDSPFANGCFPPDQNTGADLSGKKWFEIDTSLSSWRTVLAEPQRDQLQYTRLLGSSANTSFTLQSVGGKQYGLIQAAPTLCSQGSIKMNHRDSTGKVWYAVFGIEKLGDCTGSIKAQLSTPQDTYTIDSTSDEITISNIVVTADAQWTGYFNSPTYVSSIKASLTNNNASATASKQKTITATTSIKVKRSEFATNQTSKTITLNGKAELTAFGDTVSATATKTITVNLETGPDPYVTTTCSCSPNSKQFTGVDVAVTVPLRAEVKNVANENNIDYWMVYKRTESGEQYLAKKYTPTTNKRVIQDTYDFNIPASKITGQSYTETFVLRARVYFKNGTYKDFTYKDAATSCTTIVAKNPPPVNTPTPVVDNNQPPVPVIVAPGTSPAGDVHVSGLGSFDPEDGTNITYQWYSCQVTSSGCGGLTTAHSTRDGTIRFENVGDYYIWLGVTDTKGKSDSTYKSITITQPLPTAHITTTGQLKEKRPIRLDGSLSSSPSLYPLNHSLSRWTVTPLSGTTNDIVTSGSLNGTLALDVMFKVEGEYLVTYTVTNSLGLSNSKSMVLNIELDSKPIANLSTTPQIYRDPARNNHAFIEIESEAYSADGDLIGSHDLRMVYDSDNDGDYADEINERIITLDTITGKATVEVTTVGKYRFIYTVKESFDSGPFSAYIAAADYLSSSPYTAYVEVNNQAPFTSLSPQRQYKADLYVDFGDISDASKQAIRNQLPSMQAELNGNKIQTNISTGEWDAQLEPDFLKDAGRKLNHDVTWRSGIDAKYYVALTDTLGGDAVGNGNQTLNLKMLPVTSTPFEGPVSGALIAPNNTLYVNYNYPINQDSYTYYNASIPGVRGTASKWSTGYSYIYGASEPYSSSGWQRDATGYPYMIFQKPVSGGVFYFQYFVQSVMLGNFQMKSSNDQTQQYSKPSNIDGVGTMWSASGLFWMDVWDQYYNYWRKASNSFNPTISPDYYTNIGYHLYDEGHTVGLNVYWLGSTGSRNNSTWSINYNGSWRSFPTVDRHRVVYIEGNSLVVISRKTNQDSYYKFTFTNGLLVSEQLIQGLGYEQDMKYNQTTKKLYTRNSFYDPIIKKTIYTVSEFDLVSNKFTWKKVAPAGVVIVDIGFAPNGEPMYLWRTETGRTTLYYSLDNDTTVAPPETKALRTVYDVPSARIRFNKNGMYAWYSKDLLYGTETNTSDSGRIVKIHMVDENGIYSEKILSGKDGVIIDDLLVTEDSDVWIVGQNNRGSFFAKKSEGFEYKVTVSLASTFRNITLFQENDLHVYIRQQISSIINLYRYNTVSKQFEFFKSFTQSAEYRVVNDEIFHIERTSRSEQGKNYSIYSIKGQKITEVDNTDKSSNSYLDVDNMGYYYAVVLVSSGSSYTAYIKTDNPDFTGIPASSNYLIGGYSSVRVKVIDNKPYIYAQKPNTTTAEIFQLSRVLSGTNYSFKLTLVGNLVDVYLSNVRWISDSFDVVDGIKTTNVKAVPFSNVTNYTISYENNDALAILSKMLPASNRFALNTTRFDSTTGGFVASEIITSSDYKSKYYKFALNHSVTKKPVVVQSSPFTYPIQERGITYANGSFYYVLTTANTTTGLAHSASMYKASPSGISLITTISTTEPIITIKATQDENGYSYIAYVTYINGGTYKLRFADNRTGNWRDQIIWTSATSSYEVTNIEVKDGRFFIIPNQFHNSPSAKPIYYGSVLSPTLVSEFRATSSIPSYYTDIFNINLINGKFSFLATYNKYSSESGTSFTRVFYNETLGHLPTITDYSIDDYHLYLTGPTRYYMLDKRDLSLLDGGTGGSYIFKGKGKSASFYTINSVPSIIVSNGIDFGLADPDFMNTLIRDDVKPIFIGESIRELTDWIAKETYGTNIDLTARTEDAIEQAIDFVDTDVKETDSSIPGFYLNDMPITFTEEYFDFESDPKQQGRWKFSHIPEVFDNPQGQIVDHDQYRNTPYASFNKVGRYEVIFEAQDNPGVTSYMKWSKSQDGTIFYVHRKPVASFSFSLRESITSLGQVDVPIVEDSYDLDHSISMPSKGIVEKRWRWKEQSATEWYVGSPPSSLPIGRIYLFSLTVVDIEGAESDPKTQIVDTSTFIPNSPPMVTVTQPASSSSSNPSVFISLKPTFNWIYTDIDSHPQRGYELEVYRQSNGVKVYSSGKVTSSLKSLTMPSDLLENVTYYVQMKVFDGLDWSVVWSSPKYFTISLNSPPAANFDWAPKPVWEGDTISLVNQSTDPDGDALTYSWTISGPGNYTYTASTTHVSRKFIQPGDYTVRLTVSDGKAQSNVTRTIRVEPLTLEADVGYTALWLEHHLSVGHETVINPKSFYTGEIFVVSAVGSLTATRQVTASLDAIGRDGEAIAISTNLFVTNPANRFRGNLYDPVLSSLTAGLPVGQYQIKFRIEYLNGVVKEVNVPIQIIGHVQSAANVHRVQ